MRLLFHDRVIPELFILLICFKFIEGRRHAEKKDDISKESKSTFITIRIPANVATHNQDCMYEGVVRHHGDAWSPGPCIPECRCRHGHVKCSKLECPDLNCDKSIKRKWKCCPECLPGMENGTSCGVRTKGGNAYGGCCVFPFKYNGVMHYTCTYMDHNMPWCSITMNYDRDGVWGECIDNGDSEKALKFKHHRGKSKHKIHHQDNTDALVSTIANNVANGLAKEATEPTTNITSLVPTPPEPSVQPGNTTELLPALTASATTPNAAASSVQPSAAGVVPVASSPPSNASAGVSSQAVQPSPAASSQPQASSPGGVASTNATQLLPAASSIPSPSPSAGAPLVPIASVVPSASGQITPMLGTSVAVVPTSQLAATQVAPQPGQSVVSGQGAVPTPSLGGTATGATIPLSPAPVPQVTQELVPQPTQEPAPQPTQQPAPQPTQQPAPQPTQQPAPQPTQQPAPQPTQQPAPQPTQQPAPQPTQQPAPQPVPAPSPPAVEGGIPGYPFPISQTTLNPGQTQTPGPQPGEAVHEQTTTEINTNHNITTTEYWFGKANETLNRTNEVMNQTEPFPGGAGSQQATVNQTTAGNETLSNQTMINQTLSDSYNNGKGNQASYGYQAGSSPSYYQSQSPTPYADQLSTSQAGYPSYNTQGYNDNTAYQGYNGYGNTGYQTNDGYDNTGYPTNNGYDNTGYQRSNAYDNTGYQANNGYENTGYQRSNAYDNTGYQRSNAYDNTAYQQYGESQSENNVGQASYYSNGQQYQNGADPGSYYTG